MTIAERGEIIGNVEETFPARALTDPNIFVSLLFYYGMLTIFMMSSMVKRLR